MANQNAKRAVREPGAGSLPQSYLNCPLALQIIEPGGGSGAEAP